MVPPSFYLPPDPDEVAQKYQKHKSGKVTPKIERKLQAGEEVPGVAEPAAAATSTAAVSPPAIPADLAKLKVAELKQLCRDRDLKVGGLKAVLIARLVDGE